MNQLDTALDELTDAAKAAQKRHGELVEMTRWMAENDYNAGEVAEAVEKPYKYRDDWLKSLSDSLSV